MSVQEAFDKIFPPKIKNLADQTEEQNKRLRNHRENTEWKYNKFNRLPLRPLMAERVER